VKRSRKRRHRIRWALAAALGMAVVLTVSGCFLFNRSPIAKFTVSGGLIHAVGEVIAFSGILSVDPDNDDLTYEWDFGDGESAVGVQATHDYDMTGPMEVVLQVTDPSGSSATATKTLTITEAEGGGDGEGGAGPTASFTATPLTGDSPLTVSFNASASIYVGHTISAYFWDFGDGVTGTGLTTVHTYGPTTTTSYNVVLRIIADDNTEDTASKAITVTVPGAPRPVDAPTADFDAIPPTILAPLEMQFDPSDSDGSGALDLEHFFWTFGDGGAAYEPADADVWHSYVTDLDEEEFEVTLRVVDEENNSDTETQTVVIENYQPVAGFEVYYRVQDGSPIADLTDSHWLDDDPIEFDPGDVQSDSTTVWIRSQDITDTDWTELDGGDGTDPHFEPIPASDGDEPDAPVWENNNYSYDPEGQSWIGDFWPAYFPSNGANQAWGLKTIEIHWDDGTWDIFPYGATANNVHGHEYTQADDYTITVTVWDFLGGEDSFSRDISF